MNNENKLNFENMSYEEELVFGLKRWIKKGINYLNNRTMDEFFKDELSFDALCYTIIVISEIAAKIKDIDSIKEKYKDINFDELSLLYSKALKEDNYNLSYIYDLVSKAFPYLLLLLNKSSN